MHDIKLGDVTVTRVEEMHGPIMPTGAFFPSVPDEAWRRHEAQLVPDHLGGGMVHVAMQTWVLRSEGRTVLVDTGVGNDKTRPAVEAWDHLRLDFLGNLARAGVRPEDVDLVVNTHLHVDHVGWNTRLVDGEWVPTFPNATYLIPRPDFVFWDPANNPGVAGGVNEHVFEDSVAPVLAAGQVQLWQDSHTVDAHLRLRAAPGHTPGSSVLILDSGGDRALFAGDLIHTPLQVMEAGHNSCFCEDPAAAVATRRELLGWAADRNALVLPAHLSGHGALEVERRGDAFAIKQWGPFDRL
ncbi:MBL fold metallo-hydrolase [Dactylosporangium aurantiacum]|uniref:MBL fold metallo-hydrolase n=1 Tax=Dactylosporangium aurantiacum TaxID=35754 RepID=A0A9Q9IK71_9ACTN|nr:MBL fold metallo-hydrolase [Dactylosporangium aurantiacum]MDG6105583.1 MBL fold metallo-hydrolase [Dactylosporangium aurantiacum]UWZ57076.1 MBL fold metallo-hydrolase [Dactylosporangium aurantiacum]